MFKHKKVTIRERIELLRLAFSTNPQPPEAWVDLVAAAAATKIIKGLQSKHLTQG